MMNSDINKMAMSLDEIILHEKEKKEIVRSRQSPLPADPLTTDDEDDEDMTMQSAAQAQRVTMTPPPFTTRRPFIPFYYRRGPKTNQRQWVYHQMYNNRLRDLSCYSSMKGRHFGIPLLNIKKGYRQGVFGNNNYRVKCWRSGYPNRRGGGEGRRYPGLTCGALEQWERSMSHGGGASFRPGPGSASSYKSNTSYRSNSYSGASRAGPGSASSYSYHSGASYRPSRKFKWFLNEPIQSEIRALQLERESRVCGSWRASLRDQPSLCKPTVSATPVPLHRRFKFFIANHLD